MIVQAGWSDINAEQFLIIAKEAEKQAKLALLVDEDEDEDEEDADENHDDKLGNNSEEIGPLQSISKNDIKSELSSRNNNNNRGGGGGGYLNQSKGKSKGPKVSLWNAERDSLLIGSCPHSWLFDRVGAVVHHGGAG